MRVTANALDNGGFNDALFVHTGSSVLIKDSEMVGADAVNPNGDVNNALYIINSQVRTVFAGNSKLACVGAYDIDYTALNGVCSL